MAEKRPTTMPPRGPRGRRGIEKPKDAKGTFIRLLGYMTDYKLNIALALLCVLIASAANVASNYFIKPIINDFVVPLIGHENPDLSAFARMLGLMALIYTVGVLAGYLQSRLLTDMTANILEKIRYQVFDHMQTLPLKYYDSHTTGDMMSRYTNDIGTLRQMVSQAIPQMISSVLTFVGVFVTMTLLSWKLMAIVVVMLLVITKIIKFISKHSVSYFIKQQRITGSVNGYIQEMIDGSKVVKVFCHEPVTVREFDELNGELLHCAKQAQYYAGALWPITGNLAYLQYAILSVVGAGMVINGSMDLGTIGSFLQYSRNISQPLNNITMQASSILNALAGAERLFALLDEPSEVDEGNITLVNAH